jgi:hypothetical protein
MTRPGRFETGPTSRFLPRLMKAPLDTSVLVPVFYGDQPPNAASVADFTNFTKGQTGYEAHSLADGYSIPTRMPGRCRASRDTGSGENVRFCL